MSQDDAGAEEADVSEGSEVNSGFEPDDGGDEAPMREAREQKRNRSFRDGCYYIPAPEKVDKFLAVARYADRWPLIPRGELYGSSVQHPGNAAWRWLLHTRRVPLRKEAPLSTLCAGAVEPMAEARDDVALPERDMSEAVEEGAVACAGEGLTKGVAWLCMECRDDLCCNSPRLPKFSLANDFWIGREHPEYQNLSMATKWLLSLGRACYTKILLGKGAPETRAQGLTGNTIFLAQPNPGQALLQLPPATDALVDSVVVAFTRSVDELEKARFLQVSREEYYRCAQLRQRVCPVFQDVVLREHGLPEGGVPEHVRNCAVRIDGADSVGTRMDGPGRVRDCTTATVGTDDAQSEDTEECEATVPEASAVVASEEASELQSQMPDPLEAEAAERIIAVDQFHDVEPVQKLQALQAGAVWPNVYIDGSSLESMFLFPTNLEIVVSIASVGGGASDARGERRCEDLAAGTEDP